MESNSFYMPAEWETHEGTWLSWPKDPITWPDRVEIARDVYLQMIDVLSQHETVNILIDDDATKRDLQARLGKRRAKEKNIRLWCLPTADAWIRDYGPIFVHNQDKELTILDFIFNAWGNKYDSLKRDDNIPQKLAPELGYPLIEPGFVLEGGSIDVNGKGCLLTTEQCLLNKNRNPKFSKEKIESLLLKYLGATHVLWLGEGIEGDDTDGHIDDITRFVSENTIVTALEYNSADENFRPLQENLKRLQAMKDQDGKAFEVVTLPMPGRLDRDDGLGRLPASYANFYIANESVLVPIYQDPNDEVALEILDKVFPGREVHGIVCNDLIWGMGGIHCVTQQQPKE